MKRAYLADGVLTKDVRYSDNTFAVDSTLFGYISSLLDGDYCYLQIGREIVRVIGTQSTDTLLVSRAVEGIRDAYLAGESIKYIVTKLEICDAVGASTLDISVLGRISLINNILDYPQVLFKALGGICTESGLILDLPDNAGCCDASNLPPSIPVQYQPFIWTDIGEVIVDDAGENIEYI